MSTDLERELRELFRDKAGEAPVATPDVGTGAPQPVLRRARVHQVSTVIGAAVVVLALVVGSFAGMSSLLRERDEVGVGDYEVFERTATIEAFTVGSPPDWYLVNHWPRSLALAVGSGSETVTCLDPSNGAVLECEGGETAYADIGTCTVDSEGVEICEPSTPTSDSGCPGDLLDQCQEGLANDPRAFGLPMFQLSNIDVGLDHVSCRDGLPDGAAVLSVALAEAPISGITGPSFPPFPPGIGLPPEAEGPCGPGRYAQFTLNGRIFFAWIGVGPSASAEDRETVETAYETMSAIEDWEPGRPEHDTPAYVLAGGTTTRGETWRLELRPAERNVELSLVGVQPGGSASGFTVPAVPVESCCEYESGFTAVAFGAVHRDATGVELLPANGGSPIAGTIVPVPPTLVSTFDVFFIEGTGGLVGEVVPIFPADSSPDVPPPVVEPRAAVVRMSGADFGTDWRVRFSGAFADETACIDVRIEGATYDRPLCLKRPRLSLSSDGPSMHGWLTEDLYLLAGAVPTDVQDIEFESDDGSTQLSTLICHMGPEGWTAPDRRVCVATFPPEGSGTLRYLDAEGDLLFEEGIGWGSAQPELCCPVQPEQGGTYWAVYAWLGSGDQEAQIEEAQRYLEERGVHGLRGSLSCDDGAAEALSTSAEHKVAVYFETEEEANTFALDAGLLGHEAGPVVAKVTITCLE